MNTDTINKAQLDIRRLRREIKHHRAHTSLLRESGVPELQSSARSSDKCADEKEALVSIRKADLKVMRANAAVEAARAEAVKTLRDEFPSARHWDGRHD